MQISSKRAAGKRSAPRVSVSHRALCQVPPQVVDGAPTEPDTHRHPQTPHWHGLCTLDTALDNSDTLDTTGHHWTPRTLRTPPNRTPRTPRTQTHMGVSKTHSDTPDTKPDTTRTLRTPFPNTHRTPRTLGPDTLRTLLGHHRTPGHPGHPGLSPVCSGSWSII